MLPRRLPKWDRSPESLEARLRALPQQPVPADLEARLLGAIPAGESKETPRRSLASRPWRLAVCAGAAAVMAAACLLAVRTWPRSETKTTLQNAQGVAVNSEKAAPDQAGYFLGSTSWLAVRRDPDGAEREPFSWPIQEKSPLM
jgi:hypothetical protein